MNFRPEKTYIADMERLRIKTFNQYLRERFGRRVQRVPLDAGLTCPNRDGTKGTGGCIFCDNRAFNPKAGAGLSIENQVREGIARARRRYKAGKFLAYFQTFSNTYAPLEELERLYREALSHPDMAGLIVSTRPDCLPVDVVRLLRGFAETHLVWVEIGVQSARDETLERLNRCHTWEDAAVAIKRVRAAGIPVAAHVILGLPGETREDMLRTADALSAARIEGLKLHHLYAVRGTLLERMYQTGRWHPMSMSRYIDTAAAFLLRFAYEIVLMRFSGDCPADRLVAPRWPASKHHIRREILRIVDREGGGVQWTSGL